jgi:hypothetical protein
MTKSIPDRNEYCFFNAPDSENEKLKTIDIKMEDA